MSDDYSLTCRSASTMSYVPVSEARRPEGYTRMGAEDRDWASEAAREKLRMRQQLRSELQEARDEAAAFGEPALSQAAEETCLRLAEMVIADAIWKSYLAVSASSTNEGGSILLIENRSHRRRVTIAASRDGRGGVVMRIEGDGRPVRDSSLPDDTQLQELLYWISRP